MSNASLSNASLTGWAPLIALLICTVHPCVAQADLPGPNDLASGGNAAETVLPEGTLDGVLRAAFPLIMVRDAVPASPFGNVVFFNAAPQADSQQPPNNAPDNQGPPSLGDLGFSPVQTQSNPQEQALLDKRTHMLKIHQRLGLITTIPLIATVVSGASAGGRSTSSSSRDVHAALGSVTAGLYFTTAYFSVFAPKISGTRTRGQIRLHKTLAWIHGPGMILTPVLGAMAFEQKSKGEKIHGIASVHGAVGVVTAAAYGLAIVSVSVKF
jgi:hypothetical protein